MTIDELVQHYSAPIDAEIEAVLASVDDATTPCEMIRYQFGWVNHHGHAMSDRDRLRFGGKKLRGTLSLLAAEAVSGDFYKAVPAASAIEMIHNFSLVHDDIEDGDPERRHRPTVWKVWGVPQAINTGSMMQSLVTVLALKSSDRGVDCRTTLGLIFQLNDAVFRMTAGQHMDMLFENQEFVNIAEYFRMTELKTGALIETALGVGAMIGGASDDLQKLYRRFGMNFGLAFQARDDYLGIWGDPRQTGKPVGSDILARKKNLPVACALERAEKSDRERLLSAMALGDVDTVMQILDSLDTMAYTVQKVEEYTTIARRSLELTGVSNPAQDGIWQIAEYALGRER